MSYLQRVRAPLRAWATIAVSALAMAASGAAWCAQTEALAPGFTLVRSLGGIDEYRLDGNGLTVLLSPDHSVPVVTMQVTYRVGSRNEVTGTTGATHLLEHMMFKGSKSYDPKMGNGISTYMARVGAQYNATTGQDSTSYYGTLAPENLEGYMAIEADRMRNLLLREEDRQSEMTVVRNEYEQGENDPSESLNKEAEALAFLAQPYHHSVIGWRSDIENVPIAKLREFHDTFYWPNNAAVILVGDFESQNALAMVRKLFGGIPRAPHAIPVVYTQEPPQTGPRRAVVKRAGALGAMTLLYKVPSALDADLPALDVLGSILTSGEVHGLRKALVDSSIASEAQAGVGLTRDPGVFTVDAWLALGVTHEQLEKAVLATIERIKKDGVTAEELAQVVSRYRASEAFRRDGPEGVVDGLSEWLVVGDWTRFVTFVDSVAKVTPADVQRVAQKYLNTDQSTTAWFVPVES